MLPNAAFVAPSEISFAESIAKRPVHLCDLMMPYCLRKCREPTSGPECKQTDEGLLPFLSLSFWGLFAHQRKSLFITVLSASALSHSHENTMRSEWGNHIHPRLTSELYSERSISHLTCWLALALSNYGGFYWFFL